MRRVFSSSRTASSMNVVSGGPPSPGKEKAGESDNKHEYGICFCTGHSLLCLNYFTLLLSRLVLHDKKS